MEFIDESLEETSESWTSSAESAISTISSLLVDENDRSIKVNESEEPTTIEVIDESLEETSEESYLSTTIPSHYDSWTSSVESTISTMSSLLVDENDRSIKVSESDQETTAEVIDESLEETSEESDLSTTIPSHYESWSSSVESTISTMSSLLVDENDRSIKVDVSDEPTTTKVIEVTTSPSLLESWTSTVESAISTLSSLLVDENDRSIKIADDYQISIDETIDESKDETTEVVDVVTTTPSFLESWTAGVESAISTLSSLLVNEDDKSIRIDNDPQLNWDETLDDNIEDTDIVTATHSIIDSLASRVDSTISTLSAKLVDENDRSITIAETDVDEIDESESTVEASTIQSVNLGNNLRICKKKH